VIKWIEKYFNKFPEEAFSKDFNEFIENFAFIATYKDEEIFETGISTLCNIEKCRKGSISIIILHILNKLGEKDESGEKDEKDCVLAIKRAKEFVKVLCRELNVKHVYLTFADVLSRMNKTNFVCKIINILNMLLLTSNETEELRNLLKNIHKTINIEDKSFFEKLFGIWCINPVSCLILCLIAEDFELSYHLLNIFGKIKLNQENYLEYAELVQVLESKEFISE
jgi:vacuole morphology and inheritance protein 14